MASVKKSIEFTNQANSSLANFGLAITLLIVVISGLVVMITMLTAVKERQKEIGVFRAVGYKRGTSPSSCSSKSAAAERRGGAVVGVIVGVCGPGSSCRRSVRASRLTVSPHPAW